MQKLPEAPDRKKGRRMRKEKGPIDKRRKLILFQQWPAGWQHLNLPTACEANVVALRRLVGLT